MTDAISRGIANVNSNLRAFGYIDLAYSDVRDAFAAWKSGHSLPSLIFVLAKEQFASRPDIFGAPADKNGWREPPPPSPNRGEPS